MRAIWWSPNEQSREIRTLDELDDLIAELDAIEGKFLLTVDREVHRAQSSEPRPGSRRPRRFRARPRGDVAPTERALRGGVAVRSTLPKSPERAASESAMTAGCLRRRSAVMR